MLANCLRGLMPFSGSVCNHRFLTSFSLQTFSVVNHRTFGYLFINNLGSMIQDDAIMTKLIKLNKVFSRSQIMNNYKISPFINTVDKTLKFGEIPFEKQSDRQFNIFEVVAYCLFKQLQGRPYFQKQVKDGSNEYFDERNYFFERFQNYITSLQIIEKQQFQMDLIANRSNFEKEYILKCEMKYAKKQIFRRFYQMCHFAETSYIICNICIFSERMADQYKMVASSMLASFQKRFQSSNQFLKIGAELKQKCNIHPFIYDEIMALFSDDIQNGYYSPLFVLQNFAIDYYGFARMNNSGNYTQSLHTISFVPTVVSYKLNNLMDLTSNQSTFVYGVQQMGKSMSLLMIIILRGYTDSQKYLLIPQCTIKGMVSSIYLLTLQSLWKSLSRQAFIQIETTSKQMYGHIKVQNKLQKRDFRVKIIRQWQTYPAVYYSKSIYYLSNMFLTQITRILELIKPITKGIIFDQFTPIVYTLQKKNCLSTNIEGENEEIAKFYRHIFNFAYQNLGFSAIFCSSIPYEQSAINNYLVHNKQDIKIYLISQEFKQKQAKHVFIIWLNYYYRLHQLTSKIKFNRKKQHQNLFKNKDEQDTGKYNDSIEQIYLELARIKQQVVSFVQLIEKDQQSNYFHGQMIVLKKCALQSILFLQQNEGEKLTYQLFQQINIQIRVNHYYNLILKWIDSGIMMQFQQYIRKKIIQYLLNKISLAKIKQLFSQNVMPQFPKFLLNFSPQSNNNSLKYKQSEFLSDQVRSISPLIWKKIQGYCWSYFMDHQFTYLYLTRANAHLSKIGKWCQLQFQINIRKAIYKEISIQSTPFFQTIFKLFFKRKYFNYHDETIINIENAEKYPLIAVQKIAEELDKQIELNKEIQNIIFVIPLNYEIPGCDRLIIRINNKIKNKVKKRQASIIHIEVGANKRKEDLQDIYYKIKKQVNLTCSQSQKDDLITYLKNKKQNQIDSQITKLQKQSKGYEKRFQQQFAKKQITLKSYEIAFVTGHKAKYLNMTAQQLKSMQIKVINFNKIIPQIQAHFRARIALSLYALTTCQTQTEGRHNSSDKTFQINLQRMNGLKNQFFFKKQKK